jgi:hypothetical protein
MVSMKESATYQMIVEEGRAEGAVSEARRVLRLLGDESLVAPDAQTAAAIEQLDDLDRLEARLKRVRSATTWPELLGRPAKRRRNGSEK